MVIAIIAILAAILLPVLNKAKVRSQTVYDTNNFMQLQLCYIMYFQDNNDWLPPNGGKATQGAVSSWAGQSDAASDYTTANIQTGLLFPYNRQVSIYVCPANNYLITVSGAPPPFKPGQKAHQTRTCTIDYSLNEITYVGGSQAASQQGVWIRSKLNQLTGHGSPGVAQKIVFVDDNELQVSGGAFGIYGQGDTAKAGNPQTGNPQGYWWNVPGNRHNNGTVFSFMDGHAESWQWRGHPVYTPGVGAQQADAASTMYDLPRIMARQFQYNSQPQ